MSLSQHAWLLATLGKLPEAIAEMRQAIASDPLATECCERALPDLTGAQIAGLL